MTAEEAEAVAALGRHVTFSHSRAEHAEQFADDGRWIEAELSLNLAVGQLLAAVSEARRMQGLTMPLPGSKSRKALRAERR